MQRIGNGNAAGLRLRLRKRGLPPCAGQAHAVVGKHARVHVFDARVIGLRTGQRLPTAWI